MGLLMDQVGAEEASYPELVEQSTDAAHGLAALGIGATPCHKHVKNVLGCSGRETLGQLFQVVPAPCRNGQIGHAG